jgi:uncharacterized membrane protein
LPFAGIWWLTFKIIDACIKKSNALRPLGIIVSILVGGGSVVAGYFIGPIVGWFIMGIGGIVAIVGVWRSLSATKEYIEIEKQQEELEKTQKQEEENWAKEEAKKILKQGEIYDFQMAYYIYSILDRRGASWEAMNLNNELERLIAKETKRKKGKV